MSIFRLSRWKGSRFLTISRKGQQLLGTFTHPPTGNNLLEKADSLGMEHIPEEWETTKIIHLGAVAKEINPETGFNFPDAKVCISLQGWLKEWDENETIQPSPFPVIKTRSRKILLDS